MKTNTFAFVAFSLSSVPSVAKPFLLPRRETNW
jgi:hypothetical protein